MASFFRYRLSYSTLGAFYRAHSCVRVYQRGFERCGERCGLRLARVTHTLRLSCRVMRSIPPVRLYDLPQVLLGHIDYAYMRAASDRGSRASVLAVYHQEGSEPQTSSWLDVMVEHC